MSERRLTAAILALGLAGVGIAGYLSWAHYAGVAPVCATGGCETVQSSPWSRIAGVPVAVIGLAGYASILASLLARGELGRALTLALTLAGAAFSGYLTYLELYTIDAICFWCVASAAIMGTLAVLAAARFLTGESAQSREAAS